ncbi:histidinol-phosphate transaminase [bacterium]|jgi:histidinol-phosphate aminotransferase|nr:histidinol-phosphate transaminase [bacterium]
MNLNNLINPSVNLLKSYTPGLSIDAVKKKYNVDSVTKLASNENPFGSAVTLKQLQNEPIDLERYPDTASEPLIESISRTYSLSENNILLGNGSDELLQMLGQCFLNPNDDVLTVSPTFSIYKLVATISRATYQEVPLLNFQYDIQTLIDAITPKTKLIFLANPNNPTGTLLTQLDIEKILNNLPNGLLVLDQAYAEFASDPSYGNGLPFIHEHKNVCILQTFSKLYGLAGLRLGYALGHPELIALLSKLKMPFNVNSLALKAGTIALKNKEFVQKTLKNNEIEKVFLYNEFEKLKISYIKTHANFILIHGEWDASSVAENLLKQGVIIRPLNSFGLPHAIRVSIGTRAQNQKFINALIKCTDLKEPTYE